MFLGFCLTGQLKKLGRLRVLVMINKSKMTILSYFGGLDNFIFKIVLLDRFDCKL